MSNIANQSNIPQQNANDVGFLSSCFINSIFQGVSLNDFVGQIEDKSEKEMEEPKPNQHPESQRPSDNLNSSITNESTPAFTKYKKGAVSLSKKAACSKSISMSYCSQEDSAGNGYSLIKTYKVSSATEKKKRLFEEKVKAMQNRLNALRKQEDDLSRKMNAYQNKEKELEQVKAEKEMLKNALRHNKHSQNQMLDTQKKRNTDLKEKVLVNVKESMTRLKIRKHAEFDLARTEKQLVNSMIFENAEQLESLNQKKIDSIKTTHESFKAEELRRKKEHQENLKKYYLLKMVKDEEETQALKDQIAEMERLEEQYVESLRTTQKQNENLFKGSWVLKTAEQQTHPKINVNVGRNFAKTSSAKKIDNSKGHMPTAVNEKSKKCVHYREKSAEIVHTPCNAKPILNKTTTTTAKTKNASRSIEKPSKVK